MFRYGKGRTDLTITKSNQKTRQVPRTHLTTANPRGNLREKKIQKILGSREKARPADWVLDKVSNHSDAVTKKKKKKKTTRAPRSPGGKKGAKQIRRTLRSLGRGCFEKLIEKPTTGGGSHQNLYTPFEGHVPSSKLYFSTDEGTKPLSAVNSKLKKTPSATTRIKT